MRNRSIYLFILALVMALPARALAQQDAVPDMKKADAQAEEAKANDPNKNSDPKADTKAKYSRQKENWAVLGDLKTGLGSTGVTVLQHSEQADFVLEWVRVEWRLGDPIDLWITRPKVNGKTPVVLYLYNFTDTDMRFRQDGWCKRAVADGFAAVGFVAALTDYRFKGRPMRQWFVSELQESLGSSVHDVQLILNYLAERGDMDMSQVGMFGMGSGGAVAILAAQTDPRIKALDVLDPWGGWPNWLQLSPLIPDEQRPKYLQQDFLNSVAGLDPLDYLPKLKTSKFRLQQTLTDPVTPKIARDRLATAAPASAQVVQYADQQELFKAWKSSGLTGWLKEQLRSQKWKEVAKAAE